MAANPMQITRVTASDAEMLDARSAGWARAPAREIALTPAPVAMAASVSPYVARSEGHGRVRRLRARMIHNRAKLCVQLAWHDPHRDDATADLDRFVDAAAIMFPLAPGANPFTMGDAGNPVNAWYWKADGGEPFDVIAHGYATSDRRPASASGLVAAARYEGRGWVVVFQRSLRVGGAEYARFEPGGTTRVAFAIWEGSNAERAAQKSVSGGFLPAELDA